MRPSGAPRLRAVLPHPDPASPAAGTGDAARREVEHLRRELLLRMAIQNATIGGAILLAAAFAVAMAALPRQADALALGAVATTGAFALQWCHSGVRIADLKAYLLARGGAGDLGWELWLPTQRPRRRLGSRWLVSTKGVFLGLQALALWLAAGLAPAGVASLAWVAAAAGCVVTAGFLFTNPKE